MTHVAVAESAGFCIGVERALSIAEKAAVATDAGVYTLGPLIHNRLVIQDLESKGIYAIQSLDENPECRPVIIRAHGVPPQVYKELKKRGITFYDATCPKVQAVQKIIASHAGRGFEILIVGDRGHAEVIGLLGFARDRGVVVSNYEDLEHIDLGVKYCVVAQTTQEAEFYKKVSRFTASHNKETVVFNTICTSTAIRQKEASSLAKEAEAAVVIGDKMSANTCRLAALCEEFCKTFHIESAQDPELQKLSAFTSIAVTAGASTPRWVIDEVVEKLRAFDHEKTCAQHSL